MTTMTRNLLTQQMCCQCRGPAPSELQKQTHWRNYPTKEKSLLEKKHFHFTHEKKNVTNIEVIKINCFTLTLVRRSSVFCIYSLCTKRLKFVSKFICHIQSLHTEEQGDMDSKCIIHNEIKEEWCSRVTKLKYWLNGRSLMFLYSSAL